MALNFPDSPNVNDEFTSGTTTWVYDGTKWIVKSISTPSDYIICTSSTRPGSPYAGQQIFETDTKLLYTYNGSDWVIVDNLSLTYTPTFIASRFTYQYSVNGPIIFDSATVNVGSHYSTSTGIFTAPVSGLYHFSFFCISNDSVTGSIPPEFRKNNVKIAGSVPYHTGTSWGTIGASIAIDLDTNDTFFVYLGNNTFFGNGTGHNLYSGHLISYR